VPERLAHPHALRGCYATTIANEGVAILEIKARLAHGSIETTARYLAELGHHATRVGDVLDRQHEAQRRERAA
jgi:site-specific recombinase XerD